MERPFQDDDRDKRVVTADGHNIGRVGEVHEDRATIERREDDDELTDEVKEMLGWNDDDETHELRRDQVDQDDDEQIYLQSRR